MFNALLYHSFPILSTVSEQFGAIRDFSDKTSVCERKMSENDQKAGSARSRSSGAG